MIVVPRPPAADPLEAFTEDEVRACVAYAKPRQRWALAGYAADLATLAVLALSGPGRALVRVVAGLAGGWAPGRVMLATLAVLAVRAAVGLPFSLRAYRQDLRAGLATQRLGGFLRDWAKGRGVGLVLTLVPLTALVLGARGEPPGWPWVAAAVAVLLVLALAVAGPVLIEPLFNRFTPLEPGPLRARLLELAATMEVPVRDVLWGTIGAAALAALSVLAAVALFELDGVRAGLGIGGLGDPLAPPGLLLLGAVGGLAVAPAASAISRWAEARADWVALEVTRDPATAVAVERRLALENRADLRPNRLLLVMFASHPSTMARIAQAWLWAERHQEARRH